MRPITQLLRQPIRTVAALVLLTASVAFMCLGWGVFRSARATEEEIQESFVTLARFGPGYTAGLDVVGATKEYDEASGTWKTYGGEVVEVIKKNASYEIPGGGMSYTAESTGITFAEFTDALEASGSLRGVYQQQFISALIPGLRTVTSAASGTQYSRYNDLAYARAVLTFTLTKEPEVTENVTGSYGVNLRGDVVDVLALHPDYEPRGKVELSCTCQTQESLDTFMEGLEVGGTYIVSTEKYTDEDLNTRIFIAGCANENIGLGLTAEDIDLSKIRPTTPRDGFREDYEYVYDDMDEHGFGLTMSAGAARDIDCCSAQPSPCDLTRPPTADAPISFAEVPGTLEDFLADPENADWAARIGEIRRQYSTVPVIGTDLLGSLYLFHENIAYVTQGRDFDRADYAEGRRVCLISETLAQANSLKVGDKLEPSFYNGGINWTFEGEANVVQYNINYGPRLYADDGKTWDLGEYEIVGLYANTEEWDERSYNLSPDTIFVPNASLAGAETVTDNNFLRSLVVKNGTPDSVAALFAEKGWPEDLLAFFDSGYSEIGETMEGFMDSPRQLFLVAAGAFIVVAAAYIALFVTRQKRNAGLMLSLGAGHRRAGRFIFVTSAVPAALACVLGTILGTLLLDRTVSRVLGEALADGGYGELVRVEPVSAVLAGLVMLLVCLILLGAASALLSRRRPLDLLKK